MTTKEYYATIGERIAAARAASGLSQTNLAAQLGIRRDVLSGYERGLKSISLVRFHSICEALGISIERTLIGVEVPESLPVNDGRFVE